LRRERDRQNALSNQRRHSWERLTACGTRQENQSDSASATAACATPADAPSAWAGTSGRRQRSRCEALYPSIAQAARVEGIVIIETTIGQTGRVLDAKLLRSIPLLDAAALDAVRQWEFTPTLLNGSPVPVVLTVTVSFKLR
jgi:protein TonB